MPAYPPNPRMERVVEGIQERLRAVERQRPRVEVPEQETDQFPSYSWQSAFTLTTGLGHRLYADREGIVKYVRMERSAADGTSTATADVLLSGSSIFSGALPSVPAGEGLGPERFPSRSRFAKGDWFQVNVTATGGGSGPLRVTIYYEAVRHR